MEVNILGPLEAHCGGESVVPTAGKPRQLLAMLALQAGHVVTVPTLIEELWGTAPPRSALTTLQTYVMHVRRRIAAALPSGDPKRVVVRQFGGYQLSVAGGQVDVERYERLAANGMRARESGDHAAGARLLRSALDMWRGPALVDVQPGPRLGAEVTRLEESRLGVLEARIDADLQLGRHQALLSELSMLTAQYPMNENLCAQHMLALYRSGRQWRALEAYQVLRDTLVDELGLEPSLPLRRVHRAVLNADPALDAPIDEDATPFPARRIVG